MTPSTASSSRTSGTTSLVRRIAIVAMAGGLALGGLACSTSGNDDEPNDPADVNVDADDILPPAEGSPSGPGAEMDDSDDSDDSSSSGGSGY